MTETVYDNSLEAVIKWTRVNMSSWSSHPEFEDAIQEGSLRAWQDQESGAYTPLHVIHRAAVWAKSYLIKPHKRPTGAPRLSRDGIGTRESDEKMWKIAQYRKEYKELHGKYPRNSDVAQIFDMSESRVDMNVRRHREGRYDHAQYITNPDGSSVIHPSYFNPVHIEAMQTSGGDGGNNRDATEFSTMFSDPTSLSEDIVLSNLDFYALLKKLNPTHRKTLYLLCVMGCNTSEIGEAFGYTRNKNQSGVNKVKYALRAAKKQMEADRVE